MTDEQPEKTNDTKQTMRELTFSEAMIGELFMLLIAIAVIYFAELTVGYLGMFSLFEAILYGVIGGGVLYQVMYSVYSLPGYFMEDLKQKLSALKVMLDKMTVWQLMCLALAAGVAEEFLFREVLQNWLVSETNSILGIVLASIAFGLAHAISIPYVVLTFVIGLGLGVVFEFTGSLLLVIIIHAVYDALAFMMIRYKPELLQLSDASESKEF